MREENSYAGAEHVPSYLLQHGAKRAIGEGHAGQGFFLIAFVPNRRLARRLVGRGDDRTLVGLSQGYHAGIVINTHLAMHQHHAMSALRFASP